MRVQYDRTLLGLLANSLLLTTIFSAHDKSEAATQLPVPCVATSCGTGVKGFLTTGAATATQSGNTLSVTQTSNTATLNWSSFNVSAAGKVVFQQPSTTSIALNRIYDSNPSSIFGALTANGQIYLINANGFLFGNGASVNVGGLLASSLSLSDQNFAAGILAPLANSKPVLTPFVDASGNVVSQPITVQPGATLTAADGGRLLLAAPNVTNGGSLSAPDGQIILAAGQNLYLQASSDSSLRGLIVEVDSGGTVANQLAGSMSAPRGNITLTGLMVNQDGRVSATTSVAANGSVILQAADTISPISSGTQISATHGGTVELGPGSLTEVLPEYSDTTTAVSAQVQLQSSVSIVGQKVLMHGATIDAPGGALSVVADSNPTSAASYGGVEPTSDPNAEIRIDSGTTINLSGSDAELPMSANLVSVQLRSNQFADDPTQRGGALQSTATNTVTVTVDVRADGGAGTPIADVASALAAVGQNIAQRTEGGGKASFESAGDVVFTSGASVNVSGGYTTYLGGNIQTTKLIGANGQLYDIGTANPLLTYTGVVNPTFTQSYDKWGIQDVIPTPGLSTYESSYVQGAAAGKVTIAAPSLYLDGTLQATAVTGALQRSAPPAGGTLTIGTPITTTTNQVDYLAPGVTFANSPTPIAVADGTALPPQTLQLPTSYLTGDGFTSTTIYSNTTITLPSGLPLQLPAGAALTLEAPRIDVDSNISAASGQLLFENVLSNATASASRAGIGIGDGVALNVNGQWTNDDIVGSGIGTAPIEQNAGSIALHLMTPGSELVVGNNVSLSANGGAWLESGGTLAYGTGGSITLDASPALAALQLGAGIGLQAFGTGTASGGSFNLSAPRIEVSAGQGGGWTEAQRVDDSTSTTGPVLDLYAPLFSSYGFSSVNLTATGAVETYATSDVLTVASGTVINAQISTLTLNSNYQGQPTGTALAAFSQVGLLPLYERPWESVSLNVERFADDQLQLLNENFGTLDVQAGASIVADPKATIALVGEGGVKVAGTLRAPGGTITISIPSYETVDPGDSTGQTDPGYVPSIGIDLAPTAVIDVRGTFTPTPSSQGLPTGTLLAGGTVSLTAVRGFVTTEAGSTIDIRGASATLDVPNAASQGGNTSEIAASAGGSLSVSAPESISLLGNLFAAAGKGNSGTAAAGSLEVDLEQTAPIVNTAAPTFPSGSLEIELVNSTAGATPSPPSGNIAVLGAQQIAASGVDSLTLRVGGAGGSIVIDNSQLSLGRQLVLDAQTFTAPSVTSLSAPTVEFENSQVPGVAPTPFSGNGTLNVQAQQIVLSGNFALQDASKVTFSSSGDVQLQGTLFGGASGTTTGSIAASGSLAIDGLRVYPDTYTNFSISSMPGNGATVTIGSTGASPGTPLSADGAVAISADNILISGTLLAPFGSINLTANDSLKLTSGSLVSVSGAGVDVPFGQTELNQGEWIYDTGASGGTSGNIITSVPTKQVSLSAPSVAVQSGAVVNIQGGGDLYAYEWVPGTGGTNDNLNACCATTSNAALSSIPNLYAILPAAKGVAAPYDPQESTQSTLGQTIYLSGGAGIAAGYYALLPARYALEPGAVLIQLESSFVSAQGGQVGTLANGTPVVGGYVTSGTTGLHLGSQLTEYEGVAIYPSGYAQKLSSYTISDASSYFSAIATTAGTGAVAEPADAGTFTISVTQAATNALDIQGTVLAAAASGGRGAQINVSAPELTITSGSPSAGDTTLAISGSVLQSWNASSLTLGGVASAVTEAITSNPCYGATCTDIAVAANNVVVDSGVQLSADQIEIVAQQSIAVQSGASLQSTSGKAGTALSLLPSSVSVIPTTSSAQPSLLPGVALLAVSDVSLPVVCRTTACLPSSVAAPNSSATSAAGGTISTASGSTLSSGGGLSLDAPGDITLAGTLNGKGASWSLSSGSVAFVGSGTSGDTLNIGSGLLATLQQAGAVRIASLGDIDIDVPVSLGVNAGGTAPTFSSLTLVGDSIDGQAGNSAMFGGGSITLRGNLASAAASPPTGGTGNLNFVANTLNLGAGSLQITGFAQTTAQVGGAVETQGAGVLSVGGNLSINAAELTPAPDAADEPGTVIAATGTLSLGAASTVSAGAILPRLVGGSLTLTAADIEDAGAIVAPSGVVSLTSSGDLHLAPTATIDTSGTTLYAVGQSAASPGGLVTLTSGGNLSLNAGSVVSVAGSATAPAGSLVVEGSSGTVALLGTINGAAAGNMGGSLTVNAGTLAGGLASLAANTGLAGFTDGVNVRVHTGDLDLAGGGSITSGRITLTADSGTVDIAGTLSAPSGAQRGLIDLSGGTGVTLESTAQLHADGSGAQGRGGEIDLNSVTSVCTGVSACTSSGSITLDGGSVVTARGDSDMGELVLRAPALTATNDVAINQGALGVGANVSQAGQVIIEPVIVTSTSAGTFNADLATAVGNASAFLTGGATQTIASRLAGATTTPVQVQAGVELQDNNAGDALSVGALDLSSFSTQGSVVNLAVRAAGSITLTAIISDGFATQAGGRGTSVTSLTNQPSGSLSFVAGADLSSANTVAVSSGSAASLTLSPDAIVRTGTGDITLAAAGDIVLQSNSTRGASVYTAGLSGVSSTVTVGSGKQAASFPTDGGNVVIIAGSDVVGAPFLNAALDGGNFSVTGWQPHGLTTLTTAAGTQQVGAYGVNFDAFDWNAGALGGGDLTVTAGGKVSNLSAATAASSPDGNATLYGAGGGLRINAAGDIASAQVYVADGVGTLITNSGLTSNLTDPATGAPVGSSFALGNSPISVWARQSIQVDAAYNPTLVGAPSSHVLGKPNDFFTYGTASALNLTSTDGSVGFDIAQTDVLGTLVNTTLLSAPSTLFSAAFIDLPPTLTLRSLQLDVVLQGTGSLFPLSTGQLEVFAGRDIVGVSSRLEMSDSAAVPTAASPAVAFATSDGQEGGLLPFQGVVHTGDANAAIIAAARDINDVTLTIPKAAQISAGRDLINFAYSGQNIAATDVTVITAGRDISDTPSGGGQPIQVGGPGSLDVFAGRNVNLGTAGGIITVGALENPNLPTAAGADLTIAVGYGTGGADYSDFVKTIIAPVSAITYQTQLVNYVESQTGMSGLSFVQAESIFAKFSAAQQAPLIDDMFFNELLLSGRAANSGSGVGFAEGYAAIDALFPGSRNPTTANPNPYSGNLSLIASQIYTEAGGNISILAPGGAIDVGLAFTPVGIEQKDPGQLGIVAVGTGNVDIYAEGDINVNASRIFTLGGGNILIWSDEGSIDAGNGSKSSLAAPPPAITVTTSGAISVNYGGSLSGSGIRTIQTNDNVAAGDVDLDAPVGTVNAGDAGIGAAGNINIAAAHVIGALNINFGGTAAGVPSDLSGLGASLSGVSAVANSAANAGTNPVAESNAAKDAAPLAQTALSWLEVFVTGLGDENCKQDDVECLKRQKSAAP